MHRKEGFKFVCALVSCAAMLCTLMNDQTVSAASDEREYFLYVGNYGKGIYAYRFHPESAKLDALG